MGKLMSRTWKILYPTLLVCGLVGLVLTGLTNWTIAPYLFGIGLIALVVNFFTGWET